MTGSSMVTPSSPRSNRECALDLISAGNTIESVASIFGMTVERLRNMIEHPPHAVSTDVAPPASAQSWHRFPGNAVYRCPDYMTTGVLIAFFIVVIGVTWNLALLRLHLPFGIFVPYMLLATAFAFAIVRSMLATRVARFEMHADAVALHTLKDCTILRYTDIVGLKRTPTRQGNDQIQLFTRDGPGMTLVPRRTHLQDQRLVRWLDSIPGNSGTGTQTTSIDARRWYSYILPACQIVVMTVVLGVFAKDTYEAKISTSWPTTDGIVTESVSLSGGRRGCPHPLHFHYVYTVGHKQYEGENYRFGGVCGADSLSVAAANPIGKHLIVHYRPSNPVESVIVPVGH